MNFPLNTLGLAHKFLAEHVPAGGFCVDATAGKGRDTAFLCSLVGNGGRVLAFDIQPAAVSAATAARRATKVAVERRHVLGVARGTLAEIAVITVCHGIFFRLMGVLFFFLSLF